VSKITVLDLLFVVFCIGLCLFGLAVGLMLGERKAALAEAPSPPAVEDPVLDPSLINARNIETLRRLLQDHTGRQIVFMAEPLTEEAKE